MLDWLLEIILLIILTPPLFCILISWRMARKVEAAVPPIGRFTEIEGAQMHYLDRGEGRDVVLIHGLAGSLYHYSGTVFDEIAKTNHVIAFDRPGCGYSERPADADATTQTQARIIQAALDKLGVKDPVIVGHSLGGAIALAHATLFPGKARGYVLLAPLTTMPKRIPPMFKALALPAWMRKPVSWTFAIPMSLKNGPALAAEIFAPDAVPESFPIASGGLLTLRPKAIQASMKDFAASGRSTEQGRKRYGEIAAPVSCLYGLSDNTLDAEHNLNALGPIPDLKIERIERAGHMLMHARPERVVEAIRRMDVQTNADEHMPQNLES